MKRFKKFIASAWTKALFDVFLWSGSKLFGTVSIWTPAGGKDDSVKVVHFAVDEESLNQSMADWRASP